MDDAPYLADSHRADALREKMRDKRYRDGYVASHTREVLARQMRNFRGGQSQAQFAEALGKRQNVISRLENPGYGAWTLRTMFEVARKLNVAVFARFVDFPTFIKYTDDLSDNALRPTPFDEGASFEEPNAAQAMGTDLPFVTGHIYPQEMWLQQGSFVVQPLVGTGNVYSGAFQKWENASRNPNLDSLIALQNDNRAIERENRRLRDSVKRLTAENATLRLMASTSKQHIELPSDETEESREFPLFMFGRLNTLEGTALR